MDLLFLVVALIILSGAIKFAWDAIFLKVIVFEYEKALKFHDGKLDSVLGPGAFWIRKTASNIIRVDMRPRHLIVPAQEILTADSISLKLSMAAQYKIVDPRAAILNSDNYQSAIYTFIQLALRELSGATTIDQFLESRGTVGQKLLDACAAQAAEIGVQIISISIKDVMFPGDLKKVFSQIVRAQKEGQAALERARGETAALRSLSNAAKLMEDNPTILQLRALQTLSESSGNTIVFGMPPAFPLPPRGKQPPPPPPAPAE
jgi:regulator of protease activity HflC (stomatin/prohibitin superfamily)